MNFFVFSQADIYDSMIDYSSLCNESSLNFHAFLHKRKSSSSQSKERIPLSCVISLIFGGSSSGSLAPSSSNSRFGASIPSFSIFILNLFCTDLQIHSGNWSSPFLYSIIIHSSFKYSLRAFCVLIFWSDWCTLALVRSGKRFLFFSNRHAHGSQGILFIRYYFVILDICVPHTVKSCVLPRTCTIIWDVRFCNTT